MVCVLAKQLTAVHGNVMINVPQTSGDGGGGTMGTGIAEVAVAASRRTPVLPAWQFLLKHDPHAISGITRSHHSHITQGKTDCETFY